MSDLDLDLELIKALVTCDCGLKEMREWSSLPDEFIYHTDWCLTQSPMALALAACIREVERLRDAARRDASPLQPDHAAGVPVEPPQEQEP